MVIRPHRRSCLGSFCEIRNLVLDADVEVSQVSPLRSYLHRLVNPVRPFIRGDLSKAVGRLIQVQRITKVMLEAG